MLDEHIRASLSAFSEEEINALVGYENASYFYCIFKQKQNMTPSQDREVLCLP